MAGAIAKTARVEHPTLRIIHVDLPSQPAAEDFEQLAALLRDGPEEQTLAIRRGEVSVPRLVRLNSTVRHPRRRLKIRSQASYLITGGFGGLGLRTAQWLVERGAKEIYLAGRRGPSAPAQEQIEDLEKAGARVHSILVDVSQRQDVQRLFERMANGPVELRGIVHAAGALDDGVLMQQTAERFAAVFAPKVQGGWLLHEFSLQSPLDFFVMFGSAAALLGSGGQSNYAAANAFLGTLAELRHRQGMPATTIEWGAWAEIGMASRLSTTQRSAVPGVGALSPDKGMELMEEAIESGVPVLAALPVDWGLFLASEKAHPVRPLLQNLSRNHFQLRPGETPNGTSTSTSVALAALLEHTPAEGRLKTIKEYLGARIASVLMLPPNFIPREDQQLSELGMDSLMALELKNELQSALGAVLPVTFFFEYPTLGLAATYLDALLVGGRRSAPSSAAASRRLAERLELAPPEMRLGVIKDYLKVRIASVLMLPPAVVLRENQPLSEIGMDSLTALELKNELQSAFGAALPATFLFEYPTLGLAATYLDALLVGARGAEMAVADSSGYEEIVL